MEQVPEKEEPKIEVKVKEPRILSTAPDSGCFDQKKKHIKIGSKTIKLNSKMKCEYTKKEILKGDKDTMFVDLLTLKLMSPEEEK